MLKLVNLYISHSWAHGDTGDKLIKLLQSEPSLPVRVFALPKDDPVHTQGADYELRACMRQQMLPAHIVIIQSGSLQDVSRWTNEELDLALNGFAQARHVLTVAAFGPLRAPSPLEERATLNVRWGRAAILDAVRALASQPLKSVKPHETRAIATTPAPQSPGVARAVTAGPAAQARSTLPATAAPLSLRPVPMGTPIGPLQAARAAGFGVRQTPPADRRQVTPGLKASSRS